MQYIVMISVVLGLAMAPGVARASAPRDQLLGESPTCVVDGGVGTFDIPLHEDVMTALHFPGKIVRGFRPRHWRRHFKIKIDRGTLLVAPRKRRDAMLTLLIKTRKPAWKVSLMLRVADSPHEALQACRFVGRDVSTADQARIDAAVELETVEIRAELEADKQRWRASERLALARARLLADGELAPTIRKMTGTSDKVQVTLGRGAWIDGEFWTKFTIYNHDWRPYRLANVQLAGSDGAILSLRDVAVDPPAVPAGDVIAQVPPGHRAHGFMRLPGVGAGVEPQVITFSGFTGPRMLVASAQEPVWVYVPKRREELEKERRDKMAEGTISLHLEAMAGAIWLGDRLGAELTDATSLKGLGVRATYSFNRYLAFEGALFGATSGDAQFKDVTWEGMQGNLVRNAALGRAQFGGVLRFGYQYIPTVRLGLGLQGASHDAAFTPAGGGAAQEPDMGLELKGLTSLATGVDFRLGDDFLAGAALSAVFLGGFEQVQSLELGVHIGYAWEP